MTQSTILVETTGSRADKSPNGQDLLAAVRQHLLNEEVSFHTPGHKGRLSLDIPGTSFRSDLTELPGLDELSNASGVLHSLQSKISSVWNSRSSFISVNGASAALTAAILACSSRGSKILLPRNVHRSAINALVLSGLDPIWYEPEWLPDWNTWGSVETYSLEKKLYETKNDLSAVVICSPNYAGKISDIEELAAICHAKQIVLIVDEAHGAHLFENTGFPSGALAQNADLVVHSMHKTLSAPTQTGVLHAGKNCPISDQSLLSALNLLQSSSPSYILMLGIEKAILDLQGPALNAAYKLALELRKDLEAIGCFDIMDKHDPLHVMIKHKTMSSQKLYKVLSDKGIYAESTIGAGLLLLLGLGSTKEDLDKLKVALVCLKDLPEEDPAQKKEAGKEAVEKNAVAAPIDFPCAKQFMNPRSAFFSDSEELKAKDALGAISCDWIAPCPPGFAIVAPGQQISQESIKFIGSDTSIRVVKNYRPLEGDCDGPHTAS